MNGQRERRLCASIGVWCSRGQHETCPGRTFLEVDAILYVCVCECHDKGETAPRIELPPPTREDIRSETAARFGRMGGKKGGPARAAALTPKRRHEIALTASRARWGGRGSRS